MIQTAQPHEHAEDPLGVQRPTDRDEQAAAGRAILNHAAIPTFRTPEAAVDAFNNILLFHKNQQLLRQAPPSRHDRRPRPRHQARVADQ